MFNRNVLQACALTADFNALPKKDLTHVGEAGNTLSGGQKTRISLARAVYADKNIYLLDDVLATLDPKVASYVFEHVILGLLKDKTRLLCTHQTQYLIHAEFVVEMSRGRIINQGKPRDVLPDIEDYLLSSGSGDSELDMVSENDLPKDSYQTNRNGTYPLPDEEFKEKGNVHLGVYSCYVKAVGRYLTISIVLAMFLMQSSKNVSDLWLSYWVTHTNVTATNTTDSSSPVRLQYFFEDHDSSSSYYLTVYALLAAFNTIFTLMRAFMFAYGGIQAAISIHKQLLKVVVRVCKIAYKDILRLILLSSTVYTFRQRLYFLMFNHLVEF